MLRPARLSGSGGSAASGLSTALRTGSDRLAEAFARAREEGRVALIAYLMTGFPDLETSARLARAALDAGSDVLELGVPFSNPLADGATIQRAGERALQNGVGLRDVLAVGRAIVHDRDATVLLMGYANPFYAHGLRRLVEEARDGGLAGFIVPDLPAEEAAELDALCRSAGLVRVSLFAPTTPDERLARLAPACDGFIYCVSLTGVTGARAVLSEEAVDFVARVRRHARVPVAVGFGIGRPPHVAALRGVADGVVVGSALVDAVTGSPEPAAALRGLLQELRAAGAFG